MPFISKDWRSPGEVWVKTEEGWEKKKILECCNFLLGQQDNLLTRYSVSDHSDEEKADNIDNWNEDENSEEKENKGSTNHFKRPRTKYSSESQYDGVIQPHCHITIKCTKEIAGFNGLSEALKRLDFRSAVHDVRRFHYICKLLDLLVSHRLNALSGCAQRVLFNIIEEVAHQVSQSQQNKHMLDRLLGQLREVVECACWGRPLGSTILWEQHLTTINRIHEIADQIEIRQPGDNEEPQFDQLPEECVREVLLRLADHRDLERSAHAWGVMARLVDELRIWRELCQFHFSPRQIQSVIDSSPSTSEDWQLIYHKLRKCYGLREEYAEMIQLCRNCRCLFWHSIGHPCIADTDPHFMEKLEDVDKNSLYVPIPPQAFLKFFSL
ncbi:F-box only protein 32 isoform X1 [Metopolophium dirhodum]|uniref:F-box only protein 32 isoform X1 n=1 Tax=Metopolophium dirhodum TaxID=44670 RepID=UPI00298FE3E6|nr:F-box only protein 32 isoform X1 [Metopolophium dirhodum]